MPTFYGAIDLIKNELRNAVVQNLGTAPSTPSKGQIYFDSTANILYWWNGTVWVAATGAGAVSPATTVTTQAVGDTQVVGTSANYAREDHKHGREAFGTVNGEGIFGTGQFDGVAATLSRSDHKHGNPVHDGAAHAAISLSSLAAPTANMSMGSFKLRDVGNPLADQDAATKAYVDNVAAGLSWKESVRLAGQPGYNNGVLAGFGTIDGVTPVDGDRILLKSQSTPSSNGIWVAHSGAWQRPPDADAGADVEGMAVFVMEGTVNADTAWVCTTNAPIVPGVTNLAFAEFAGGGTITAGAGLTQTGNQLDVGAGVGITVAADTVSVDTTAIATKADIAFQTKKYAATLVGTGGPETITHSLNTRDVMVTVLNGASPYTAVEVDWDATTVNAVTVRYNPNLGAGYRVVVIG